MYPTAPLYIHLKKSLPFSLHLGFFLNLLSKLKYTTFFFFVLTKKITHQTIYYPLFNVVLFTYNSLRYVSYCFAADNYTYRGIIAYIHVSMWRKKKSIKLQKYTTIAKNQIMTANHLMTDS